MVEKTKDQRHHKTDNRFNRFGLLIVCLILTIIITFFSIWFNLKNYSESGSDQGLFYSIKERFQKGFESEDFISNL